MALKIRLARGGSHKRPFYKIVVAENSSPRDGKFVERIGFYNPLLPKDKEQRLVLKTERVEHWLKIGAKPTDRVARLLSANNIIPPVQRFAQTKKNQPKAKAQERLREIEKKNADLATAAS